MINIEDLDPDLDFHRYVITTEASDVRSLIKPLEKFNIIYLLLIRIYPDDSRIALSTHPQASKHFVKQKYYEQGLCGNFESYHSGNTLWSAIHPCDFFHDLREFFHIDNGIIITKKNPHYCDMFYFASTPNNQKILNFYLNNMNIFDSFIKSFYADKSDIIKTAEPNLILYPSSHKKDNMLIDSMSFSIDDTTPGFSNSPFYQLTKREYQCAFQLCQGNTAKEIARTLAISHRTVEKYVASIIRKTNTKSAKQFIALFQNKIRQ